MTLTKNDILNKKMINPHLLILGNNQTVLKDLKATYEQTVSLIYMDPPYNQHPYGSNYFMLNLIDKYEIPKEISKISGIPKDWNRSKFNQSREALKTFENLCKNAKAKYLLISFNNEGFIKKEEMINMLSKIGKVTIMEKKYNTFRGSRNLNNRDIHVKEFLYLVEVDKYREV